MKIKDNFILKEVAGNYIIVPLAGNYDLNSMITLNESGVCLFNALTKGATTEELLSVLKAEYCDVDDETAMADINSFIEQLKQNSMLEE